MSRRSSPRPSSMGRRPIKDTAEQDAFTRWRRVYLYTQRPGVTSWIKRNARRRERHEARQALARAWDDGYTTGNAHNGRRDANPYRGGVS